MTSGDVRAISHYLDRLGRARAALRSAAACDGAERAELAELVDRLEPLYRRAHDRQRAALRRAGGA